MPGHLRIAWSRDIRQRNRQCSIKYYRVLRPMTVLTETYGLLRPITVLTETYGLVGPITVLTETYELLRPMTVLTETYGLLRPMTVLTETYGLVGPITVLTETYGLLRPMTVLTETYGLVGPITVLTETYGLLRPMTVLTETYGLLKPMTVLAEAFFFPQSQEQIQYHIEIQDAQGLDGVDGEVMVVLDLSGQDLPETVAQAIMELAQNRRRGDDGSNTNVKFFMQDSQQLTALPADAAIEHIKIEDIDMFESQEFHQVKEETKSIIPEIELEKVNVVDAATQEMKTRYLVHNLAELERTKVGTTYKPRRSKNEKQAEKPVHILSEIVVPKVEAGVQCELIPITGININSNNVQDDCTGLDHLGAVFNKADFTGGLKGEPLWAEDSRQNSEQPAFPEETAAVPVQEKTCTHCSFTCSNDLELGRHLKKIHKEVKAFVCSLCESAFELELSYQVHTLLHTDAKRPMSKWKKKKKKSFCCPVCFCHFPTAKKLSMHTKTEHCLTAVYSCDACRFVSLSKAELAEHSTSQEHIKKVSKISECPVCKVVTLKMTAHLAKKHPEHRPHICHICSFRSKSVTGLKYHIQTHAESKNFVCPICNRACKSKIVLKRHIKNHDPVKKYKCSLCSFATNESYEHKRHIQRVHSKKSYYSCKHCNLSFLQSCDLKLHAMSEHQSRDSFFCSYCEFSCETRTEYKIHIQSHTGKHRFLCETCDFTTPFRAHLERHRNTHTDIRPYKCSVCGYECREHINLKKHMVTHSDEKPFSCSLCPYTCKLKNLLDSHVRIVHTSIKPYSCTSCPYRAKTSGNLKKHMWIHQQIKPYQCRFCIYTAREKNKLVRHENTKHKDIILGMVEKSEVPQEITETVIHSNI
ncbi:hypothetical protein Btru_068146 [Bulinus truncatus]|nr:hypothetical protein Btru_068146 [Bulinus truncatus]